MAQEQAKSPPGKATPEAKDEVKGPLEAMMAGKGKPDEAPERSSELPRRSTLADRLKAEQRRRETPNRDTPKRDEPKPQDFKRDEDSNPEFSETTAGAPSILVPIVIFWFLALLVWRAQELRLMAAAMRRSSWARHTSRARNQKMTMGTRMEGAPAVVSENSGLLSSSRLKSCGFGSSRLGVSRLGVSRLRCSALSRSAKVERLGNSELRSGASSGFPLPAIIASRGPLTSSLASGVAFPGGDFACSCAITRSSHH